MSVVISPNFTIVENDLTPDHPIIGWNNIVTAANIVADSEDANYPASNLANPATHLFWKSGNTNEQYLTITPGSADAIDHVAIARHNLGSGGITIEIEGNNGGGYASLVGPAQLGNDRPALFRFNAQPLSGLRIKLTPENSPSDLPEIAVVYAGKLLVLQRRLYVGLTPPPLARISTVTNATSQNGNYLGSISLNEMTKLSVPLSLLEPAWYRENFDLFIDGNGRRTPFFFAPRPQSYPNEVGYMWLTADPMPVPTGPSNLIALKLDMMGVS